MNLTKIFHRTWLKDFTELNKNDIYIIYIYIYIYIIYIWLLKLATCALLWAFVAFSSPAAGSLTFTSATHHDDDDDDGGDSWFHKMYRVIFYTGPPLKSLSMENPAVGSLTFTSATHHPEPTTNDHHDDVLVGVVFDSVKYISWNIWYLIFGIFDSLKCISWNLSLGRALGSIDSLDWCSWFIIDWFSIDSWFRQMYFMESVTWSGTWLDWFRRRTYFPFFSHTLDRLWIQWANSNHGQESEN